MFENYLAMVLTLPQVSLNATCSVKLHQPHAIYWRVMTMRLTPSFILTLLLCLLISR